MLMEECHPSSLPLVSEPTAKRTPSVSSLSGPTASGRVEKERNPAAVRKMPKVRKRVTR